MRDIKLTGKRPDIPRLNISKQSLYNLGLDVHSLMDLHEMYLEDIKPDYIDETFKETKWGITYRLKINPLKAKIGTPVKYVIHEMAYKDTALYYPVTMAPVDSKIETDVLLYDNMKNVVNSAFDTTGGMAPFHFVYGKGDRAVEYFIGSEDNEAGESYAENITRDI